MPLLGFKKELAPKILKGEKPFTLRDERMDGRDPQAGQTLFMGTGVRTKHYHRFAEKMCHLSTKAKLSLDLIEIPELNLKLLTRQVLENFAKLDGFENYEDFSKFHSLNFTAKTKRLIAWIPRHVREWAIANAHNPLMRIALCGYAGEHDMPSGWDCVAWKATGGYAAAAGNRENARRERIWFSPHCLANPSPELNLI